MYALDILRDGVVAVRDSQQTCGKAKIDETKPAVRISGASKFTQNL